jgi:hypothetical protein
MRVPAKTLAILVDDAFAWTRGAKLSQAFIQPQNVAHLALDLHDQLLEKAQLQKRIAELEAQATDLEGALIVANKSAKRRGKRIADLQADAERLDTVQALGLTLVQFSANHWVYGRCSAKTAREAIDMQRSIAAQRQKAGE